MKRKKQLQAKGKRIWRPYLGHCLQNILSLVSTSHKRFPAPLDQFLKKCGEKDPYPNP